MNEQDFEQEIKQTFWWYDEESLDFVAYWQFHEYLEWQCQLRYMGAMYAKTGDVKWLQFARNFLRDHHIGIDTDTVEAFEQGRLTDCEVKE